MYYIERVIFLVACLSSISHGLIWDNQSADTTSFKRCSDLHYNFRSRVYASRKCSPNGEWQDVDLTNCTMHLYSDTVLVSQATLTPANPFVVSAFNASVSRLNNITVYLPAIHNHVRIMFLSSIDW